MNSRKQYKQKLPSRQHGAVVIIVAICLTVLIGMLALVLDLGHLYIGKTELQNAADAAALSGAKELNGTLLGVQRAKSVACDVGGLNKYDLNSIKVANSSGTPATCSNLTISVGSNPDATVGIDSITSSVAASNKSFLKVETGSRSFNTWFARIWALLNMQTFGTAVAGKYEVDVAPIAVCSIDKTDPEQGFERGVSYNVANFNPLGAGTMYWIDPESNTPGVCTVTSTSATLPYICSGKTSFTPIIGQTVNTNTGISDPQLEAFDSRFDVFNSKNKCDPVVNPPDTNIKEYIGSNAGKASSSWMNWTSNLKSGEDPQQTITPVDKTTGGTCENNKSCAPKPYASRTFVDYGVLWSAYRPVGKTVSDWSSMYKGSASSYPETSPYSQTSGSFFRAPSHTGASGRRVLNMTIIDCTTAGGVCRPATVLAIGKFFLQKTVNQSSPKEVDVEFGGLLATPLPSSDIRLYR